MDGNLKSKIKELSVLTKIHGYDNLQVAGKLLEIGHI